MSVTTSDRERLAVFHRIAEEAKEAARNVKTRQFPMRMVSGYVEVDGWLEGFRFLCIPVRRAYLKTDKANFQRAFEALMQCAPPALRSRAEEVGRRHQDLLDELNTASIFDGQRVRHAEVFEAWLEAAVFHDIADRREKHERMVQMFGRAVEGIAIHATERMAECVIELGALIAELPGRRPPGDAS